MDQRDGTADLLVLQRAEPSGLCRRVLLNPRPNGLHDEDVSKARDQSINVTVLNPWFLGTFLGTGVACVLVAVSSFLAWHKSAAVYLLAGCALYLFGTVLVTSAINVPRNDALANVNPVSPDAAKLWGQYVAEWTAWNHVRTGAALAAAASFTIGLYLSRAGAAT